MGPLVDLHRYGGWPVQHPEHQVNDGLIFIREQHALTTLSRNIFTRVLAIKMTSHKAK
jgi:hypothetical protein